MSKIKGDAELEEVLKFEDQYYALGEVVEYVANSPYFVSKKGRIVGFNKHVINNGITLNAEVLIDISDKYESKIDKVQLKDIEDINHIKL